MNALGEVMSAELLGKGRCFSRSINYLVTFANLQLKVPDKNKTWPFVLSDQVKIKNVIPLQPYSAPGKDLLLQSRL